MRPPPLWLPQLLLFCSLGAATPPPGSAHLATPRHPKIHLHDDKQVLSWEPVSPGNDMGPVVYRVEYTYDNVEWIPTKVNCTKITATKCDFTRDGPLTGFSPLSTVFLRVRAEQGNRTSAWVMMPSFQYYRNVTVGPPKNLSVTPGEGSLIIHFSPPFEHTSVAIFEYHVRYWEKTGIQQVKGPFQSNSIVLDNLKPFRVYCLQVEAQLVVKSQGIHKPGHLSNTSCHETRADASTKLQQVFLISLGTFLVLLMLSGACFFLFLKYQSLVKYWFHTPPSIPVQIEEYLKDPAQPILEALDRGSSPKDDTWDSVSIISFPEKEQENMLQTL
ncbi:interferon gamma receptor 2 isoform X2 [Nannospalax galili]|uniref:interferon gamma receptor 2 isoform X2 n=1 Tax=Nannospalax galili TaxID=1026970 RepID=UPI00081A1CEB|nr:interferon gamma receptor 2 isoform X2 [Nannospalax galili]